MTWLRREDLEAQERQRLAPCATASHLAGDRRLPESEDPLRTCLQRDRDRILHSTAFRRLQHKTQVFSADEGDHYRSRMTHSMEVSQMARSAALALRLNPDLAETVALAHDLGHPPFGHVGEEALNERMQDHGGFRHNAQGVRIVDLLEDRHGHGFGLNLTLATRRSLVKGKVPEGFPLSTDLIDAGPPPLEAVVVDRCDKIAYLCHDLDDGLRAGLIHAEDLASLGLWQAAQTLTGSTAPPRILSGMAKIQLLDLIEASHPSIEAATGARPRIQHSGPVTVQSQEVLAFLRTHFYQSRRVLAAMAEGRAEIESCFTALLEDPSPLPANLRARMDETGPERAVCDFIAGMTDRYLMRREFIRPSR